MKNGEDRKGKFIAVANMKGGVGKTTTVVSLAEALAADDETKKILVIDLDPQASASVAIAGDKELNSLLEQERSLEAMLEKRLILKEKISIHQVVHPTICGTTHKGKQLNVALLPCGPRLRIVERQLIFELTRSNFAFTASDGLITRFFKNEIELLARDYDVILYDCAPGISPVTEIAVRLSDLVIVPTIPDRLSVYGLNAFRDSIWRHKSRTLPAPKGKPSVLVARMDKRITQHVEVLAALESRAKDPDFGFDLFASQVPTSAALVEALMKPDGLTFIQKYTPQVITNILNPLVREIKGKFENGHGS